MTAGDPTAAERSPAPGAAPPPDLFGRRTAIAFAIVIPALLAVTLASALLAPVGSEGPRSGANSYSVSAVGFKGFADMLDEIGVRVLSSRRSSAQRTGAGAALVLLEPPGTRTGTGELSAQIEAARVRDARIVVVIPKWASVPDSRRPGWAGSIRAVPVADTVAVLAAVLGREVASDAVSRPTRPLSSGWTSSIGLDAVPDLARPQLLSRAVDGLEPLLWSDDGVLAAVATDGGVIVVSDPDLMNNAGLAAGDNAVWAHRLVVGDPPVKAVVFDETLHGFTSAPSVWRGMLRFPLSLVTVHLCVLAIAVLWSGAARFGPARSPAPRYVAGTPALVDATAALVRLADAPAEALHRYRDLVLGRVTDELAVSSAGVRRRSRIDHLDAIGRRRGADTSLTEISAEIDDLSDRRADRRRIVDAALALDRWRRSVLDGSHRRP